MTSAMVATLVSALLVTPPPAEPVPVQRPGSAPAPVEAPPPAAEPAPPVDVAPAPVEATPVEAAPVEAGPVEPAPVEPAPVEPEPLVTPDAAIEPPPPVIDREVTEEEVAAATPIEADRREAKISRAQTMIAAGAIAAIGGFVMAIAGGVERAKPDCKFGLDDCANAPRPRVAAGLGIGGAVLLVGGAALIGIGAYRLRRVRASLAVDGRSAGLVLVGRF